MRKLWVLMASIKKRGALRTLAYCANEVLFDLKFGTRTSGMRYPAVDDMSRAGHAVASPNMGTNWLLIKEAFACLSGRFGLRMHEVCLLDYGSGAGRVLVSALHFGVRRVLGVEFSADFCKQAAENLARAAKRRPLKGEQSWEIVCADALTFPVPAEVNCAFLYHPFGPPVIGAVAERLFRHAQAHCPNLIVVYVNPVHLEAFESAGFGVFPRSNEELAFLTAGNCHAPALDRAGPEA